ncbi:MAG: respiratory nitrate reductase subunit gamma [Mycobacterium leprae]
MTLFAWVIYPYLCLAVLVIGSLWRYDTDQLGWTAKSSEFLEKRRLRWGSLLFHWGIIFVFMGHVGGLLVPIQLTRLATSDEMYHMSAMVMGGLSGLAAFAGLVLLFLRRTTVKRVWRNTTAGDMVALVLLIIVAGLGMSITLGYNVAVEPYEYRLTLGPWVRGLLLFHPDVSLMATVPTIIKAHVLIAFTLFAVSPFTRLVHIWSIPLAYLGRAPQQLRRRHPVSEVKRLG